MPNLFPYTNTHELNLDWILQVVKDFQTKYTNFDQALADALAAIEQGKNDGLEEIAAALTSAEADIVAVKDSALSAIGDTKDEALTALSTALTNATTAITDQKNAALAALNASVQEGQTIIEQLYNTLPASAQDILGQLQVLDSIITGGQNITFNWQQGTYIYPEGTTPPTPPAVWTESPSYNIIVSSRYITGIAGRRIRITLDNTLKFGSGILLWNNNPPGGAPGGYAPGMQGITQYYADVVIPLNTTAMSIDLMHRDDTPITPADIPGHIKIEWITDFVSQRIIAPKESSTTADVAREEGEYFFLDGDLYVATDDIAVGDTIAEGTNCEKKTVGGEVSELKSALYDYQNAISEYEKPTNLYNKNSNLNHNDVRVSASGNFQTLSGSSVSHPIKIDKNKSYVFKFSTSYYGAEANRIVRRCDANGNLVDLDAGFLNAEIVDNAYGRINASLWNSRPQWEYFCVNVRTADKGVMIIAEGDTLPAYSDYFDPYWVILESALPPEIPLPANAENNPLYGKKLSVDGDSIMYGAGYTGGFAKIIAENNSMPVQNIAKTGATLATGTTAEGVNRQWICTHIANIASDADYILFDGGVNDAALGVPLGTLTNGYTDTMNTAQVIGALETACKTLQTAYAGKKYGFVFPHDCYSWDNIFTTAWKPAMKECLKKWGVPFIDLGELTGQLNNISALRQYTQNSDGWHPTEEGYRLFYVDKITAWMKTL